jgi:hypothetical protein
LFAADEVRLEVAVLVAVADPAGAGGVGILGVGGGFRAERVADLVGVGPAERDERADGVGDRGRQFAGEVPMGGDHEVDAGVVEGGDLGEAAQGVRGVLVDGCEAVEAEQAAAGREHDGDLGCRQVPVLGAERGEPGCGGHHVHGLVGVGGDPVDGGQLGVAGEQRPDPVAGGEQAVGVDEPDKGVRAEPGGGDDQVGQDGSAGACRPPQVDVGGQVDVSRSQTGGGGGFAEGCGRRSGHLVRDPGVGDPGRAFLVHVGSFGRGLLRASG